MTSDDLTRYLRSKGYEDKLIQEAGLAAFDEKYGMHDKFWNRVMFPIQDSNNRVIGFGGRVMGDGKPKYLNSPETMIFDKSRNLYGLNFARSSRAGNFILCEGYMDVIAMHQAGFGQAVASLGTSFTAGQANLLRRFTGEVILAYDSDGAGVNAALRAIGILGESGLTGKVLNLEPYKDPDEFMKKEGAEAFRERIAQAENSFFFELRMLQRDYDLKDPESKTRFHREIARKLCGFSEEVERENYIEAVAQKYHIGFENLRRRRRFCGRNPAFKRKTIRRKTAKSLKSFSSPGWWRTPLFTGKSKNISLRRILQRSYIRERPKNCLRIWRRRLSIRQALSASLRRRKSSGKRRRCLTRSFWNFPLRQKRRGPFTIFSWR